MSCSGRKMYSRCEENLTLRTRDNFAAAVTVEPIELFRNK
jgi:hypothetical protein